MHRKVLMKDSKLYLKIQCSRKAVTMFSVADTLLGALCKYWQHATPSEYYWILQSTLGRGTTAWQVPLKYAFHNEELSDWLAYTGIHCE